MHSKVGIQLGVEGCDELLALTCGNDVTINFCQYLTFG